MRSGVHMVSVGYVYGDSTSALYGLGITSADAR